MLNRAEFSNKQNVSYWDGKRFYSAHVSSSVLNPVTNCVEYRIYYRVDASSKGFMRCIAKPQEIKESAHFEGG